MPILFPPSSTVKVEVSESTAARFSEQGWRAADDPADVGERRCDVCEFVAKSAGGLAAHRRKHKSEE